MVEDLDLKAELEEVTKSKTRFLSGQTGRKFLKAVTGNPSDLYFVQDCRTGYFDPNSHGACRHHTGYWPRNMTALLGNEKFGHDLRQLVTSIRDAAARKKGVVRVHLLCWCNKGCHRSVAWSRAWSFAAPLLGWECLTLQFSTDCVVSFLRPVILI